jgi:hypothetical protein
MVYSHNIIWSLRGSLTPCNLIAQYTSGEKYELHEIIGNNFFLLLFVSFIIIIAVTATCDVIVVIIIISYEMN